MTTRAPRTIDESRELARALLAELPDRWMHTQAVASKAQAASIACSEPQSSVIVRAAWLHDIGYATGPDRSGLHALDGARWLSDRDVHPTVVALVAHHSGARFEAAERNLTGELERFPEPDIAALDLLTSADMTTGPRGEPMAVDDRIAEILHRYDTEDPVHRAVLRAKPELIEAVRRVESRFPAGTAYPM